VTVPRVNTHNTAVQSGGPDYQVELGRYDGRVSTYVARIRIRVSVSGIGRIRIRGYDNFLKNPIQGYVLLFFK